MELKSYIWFGAFIGGTVGSGLGMLFDHGNALGLWSLLFGTFDAITGIWAGYRMYQG